jgi:hypothetical protein
MMPQVFPATCPTRIHPNDDMGAYWVGLVVSTAQPFVAVLAGMVRLWFAFWMDSIITGNQQIVPVNHHWNFQQVFALAVAFDAYTVAPTVFGTVDATAKAFMGHRIQMLNLGGKGYTEMRASVDVSKNSVTASEQDDFVGRVRRVKRNQKRAAIRNAAGMAQLSADVRGTG